MREDNWDHLIDHWSNFKRLSELCSADTEYAKSFLKDPGKVLKETGLFLDANIAKEAIEIQMRGNVKANSNYYLELYDRLFKNARAVISDRTSIENFANHDFKEWFQRQKNWVLYRDVFFRKGCKEFQTYFTPISFELTEGCSGNCPFCCLAPKTLSECFFYNDENANLWNNILILTREIIGEISGLAVCYFATEPFDNPDYEKFIKHFYPIFRYFPQTTTIKAIDDIKRTKRLLHMLGSEQLYHSTARFSVISKRQLGIIHQEFTPKELAYVQLVMNNPESHFKYTLTGRAVNLKNKLPIEKLRLNSTCICTIGFIVNMPKRTIKLIAPRNSDVGMRVFETMTFTDELTYKDAIYKLIGKWMQPKISHNNKLSTGNITFERSGDYLIIEGDRIIRTIRVNEDMYRNFNRLLEGYTLEELFKESSATEYDKQCTTEFIDFLYGSGYIDIA